MVSTGLKVIFQSGKNGLAIMTNFGSLAMHQLRRTNHSSSKHLSDCLVPKANTEKWNFPRKTLNNFQRNTGIVRSAGTGRNNNPFGTQLRFDLIDGNAIIPTDFDRLTKLAQVLDQVVSKGIVVVDN